MDRSSGRLLRHDMPSSVPATGSDKFVWAWVTLLAILLAQLSGTTELFRWHMVCKRLVLVLKLT